MGIWCNVIRNIPWIKPIPKIHGHELADKKNIYSHISRKFKIRSLNRNETNDSKLLGNRLLKKTKI